MPNTARRYTPRVDEIREDRRDLFSATAAADFAGSVVDALHGLRVPWMNRLVIPPGFQS
jgi:hypothetical protein